ncbi:MAG: DMT family transporter [Candidatus Eremiobacteraeota bacterium]|nr:DMT family transporter [Candidatus Eremiobacteraeota bacterium]
MQVGFSLLAAFFAGAADFCGGLAAKKTPVLSVTLVSQLTGLVLLAIALPFFPEPSFPSDYLWAALGGVCGVSGLGLLYHALSIGKMGVVSPVTAVLAAAVPVIVATALGQHLAVLQVIGILFALVAIALISFSFEDGVREFSTRGLKEAAASGIVLSGWYLFLAHTHRESALHTLIAARVASVAFVALLGIGARTNLRPQRETLSYILLSGILDITASAFFLFATFSGALAIAAVLTSLYPASTVFLARVILRERLGLTQWFGVAFALVGVALIALRR